MLGHNLCRIRSYHSSKVVSKHTQGRTCNKTTCVLIKIKMNAFLIMYVVIRGPAKCITHFIFMMRKSLPIKFFTTAIFYLCTRGIKMERQPMEHRGFCVGQFIASSSVVVHRRFRHNFQFQTNNQMVLLFVKQKALLNMLQPLI